jgi:hypothetical protein
MTFEEFATALVDESIAAKAGVHRVSKELLQVAHGLQH